MGDRCQILVAVEPAVLRGALGILLTQIGADDVTVADPSHLPPGRFDVAIVTYPDETLIADVVIETPRDGLTVGHLRADGKVTPISITAPAQLLSLLDQYCPAKLVRADATIPSSDRKGGH